MPSWLIPILFRLYFCFTIAVIEINGGSVSWSSWGDCSVTCGQGTQTRSKICLLGPGLCLSSDLLGKQTQQCNSSPCPKNSSLFTANDTYTPTTNTPSATENPTSYGLTTISSLSPTPSITTSKPAVVIGNSFFTLSPHGCHYSNMRISRTVKVRSKFHCTSICARDSECVAFNLDGIKASDSSPINEYLKCEILEKDNENGISLSQVSENCKGYERVTI